MTELPPILVRWEGDCLKPVGRAGKSCDEHLVVGRIYEAEVRETRSMKSHRHQFAEIREAWENLPDELRAMWPSAEHLRKYALIRAGYCNVSTIACRSHAMALQLSAVVGHMDEFAVVTVEGKAVTIYTPKSQSRRAMGAKVFQESKNAVLEFIADLIGVAPQTLMDEAEMHA